MYKAVCSSLPLHSGQHSGKAGVDNPSEDTSLFASRLGFIAFTLRSHVETFRGFGGERSRSLATASDIGYAWVRTSAGGDVLSDPKSQRGWRGLLPPFDSQFGTFSRAGTFLRALITR